MPEGIHVDPQIIADCGPFISAAFVVFVVVSLVVVTMEHRVIFLALHEGLGFCMVFLHGFFLYGQSKVFHRHGSTGGKDLKYLQWLCGFCLKVTFLVVCLVFSLLLLRWMKKPLGTGFCFVLVD